VLCCPQALHTFGFRGEALSSLAALGELSVITRTAEQTAATRLEFDRDGNLTRSTPVARAVGTTVAIKDLFAPLPVRRQVRRGHCACSGGCEQPVGCVTALSTINHSH
jgi:DNA mismatch repair protein PMS2